MTKTKLHMIGNAHIDPVWLWSWHEGFHEVKATFRSALDRMNEYESFLFVASSAAFYDWVEKSDPAMFAEVQQRVKEGRWQVVGGWWIEPDCNIPSGESFVRQGVYGQRFFKSRFGVTARVGFNVDSFGHAGTLPQILTKSGIPYYTFLRPMPHEKGLPSRLFWWEADDGSRVLTFRIPFEYLSWGKDLDEHVARCAAEVKAPFDEGMAFYGVGNHGGGPTKENLDSLKRLSAASNAPDILISSPEAFFDSVSQKNLPIPTVHSDLQMHAPGCYAAHSGIKQWNRRAENRLIAAEKWSLLASWVNKQPYPDLEQAWKSVLFNQFHDILAGTSLESAYDDARDSYGEALAIADRALNYAVQSFAWNVKIPQDDAATRPIIVFNPHTWPIKAAVEIETNRWKPEAVLVDEADQPVPHQSVQSTTATFRARIAISAEIPALGYRVYRLLPNGTPGTFTTVQASDGVLENGRFRLEIDTDTGYVARLYDKQAQVEVFTGDAAKPVVIEDTSDTWGHNVFKYDQVIGAFKATSVKLAEHGPVKSVIRVISAYGQSRLIQDFTMYPDRDQIDVHVVIDWHEQFKLLKLRFPVSVKFMRVTNEIAYGHIEYAANGDEASMQGWVDVSGVHRDKETQYGFSLLNDAKYSLDVNVRDIGMTVLRSPAYAHHIPSTVEPGKLHAFIDQGIQRFSYSMLAHTDGWEQAETVKRAAELNQRPTALWATFHPNGTLPQVDSYIDVQPSNILVSVLKQAEEGDDLIVRVYETAKIATRGTIRLPHWNRTIEADFAPCEIKTFRVPRDASKPITETDLLEWELEA